jgi:hypothetical protein
MTRWNKIEIRNPVLVYLLCLIIVGMLGLSFLFLWGIQKMAIVNSDYRYGRKGENTYGRYRNR